MQGLRLYFQPWKFSYLLTIIVATISNGTLANASNSVVAYADNATYQRADQEYSKFSTRLLRGLVRHTHYPRTRDISTLLVRAKKYRASGNPANALGLIVANMQLIKSNINSKEAIEITGLLLKANEINTATSVLNIAKNESDPSVISNIQFEFAKYYYSRNNWAKTSGLIDKIANDLPPRIYQHAMLIDGISLQNMRKHRKSLGVYGKIPKNSPFYVTARMNMAVADIRQDWWTDAYDILTKLLKRQDVRKNTIVSDHINTMIGYIFLQQEYFRNSRNAFHQVEIKGTYTNQALLGIALDAAYQKDYVGALNAAKILKKRQGRDLPVDEANLLLPYFYEKLGQLSTASAGYSEAIKYFENRIKEIDNSLKSNNSISGYVSLDSTKKTITIGTEDIDIGKNLPQAFFNQFTLLRTYQSDVAKIPDQSLNSQYQKLVANYRRLIWDTAQSSLKQKARYITDYMNQSRYGLARLYDRSGNRMK